MAAPQRVAGRVLIIDDEESILATFRLCLEDAGYSVDTANTAAEGLRLAARQPFDVCLLDLSIGDESGLEVMPRLKQLAPWLRVVIVSAHSAVDAAMDALRAGAEDYLVKPCLPEQLRIAVLRQVEARKLTARVEQLEREAPKNKPDLESQSPLMAHVIETARHVAATDANILLLGESGTGKGELAKAIHRWSNRSEGEFVTINCPSLSAELLESELFGHNKGSFTGATQSTVGRVTQADGGTLFLDEIGEADASTQVKLLKLLEDKRFRRVGGLRDQHVDVRIVAATHRPLDQMVKAGQFRADLFYRLRIVELKVPPLRDRGDDVLLLARVFLQQLEHQLGAQIVEQLGDGVRRQLQGNLFHFSAFSLGCKNFGLALSVSADLLLSQACLYSVLLIFHNVCYPLLPEF